MAAPASTGQDAQDGFLEEDFDCTGESSCDLRGVHKSGSDSDDDGNRVIRVDEYTRYNDAWHNAKVKWNALDPGETGGSNDISFNSVPDGMSTNVELKVRDGNTNGTCASTFTRTGQRGDIVFDVGCIKGLDTSWSFLRRVARSRTHAGLRPRLLPPLLPPQRSHGNG